MSPPESKPAAREKLHHRSVVCQGFKRADGLWDIEAELVDTKTYSYHNRDRGEVAAGEPVHQMQLRLTIDLDMNIIEAQAGMDYSPFTMCRGAREVMKRLEGMQIKAGWLREVSARIGRRESCTHLYELLRPLSTTAYQTLHRALEERAKQRAASNPTRQRARPKIIDQCYSLASDSAVVKLEWPAFYTGDDGGESNSESKDNAQ